MSNSSDEEGESTPGAFVRKRKLTLDERDKATKRSRGLNSDLYKPPTAEELKQLREIDGLFHSNLFRLQFDELIAEVRVKDKYKVKFNLWFEQLKRAIGAIEDTAEFKLSDVKEALSFPELPDDERCTLQYVKPIDIELIGSHAFDCDFGLEISIDVLLTIPKELFKKLDYQNYRYLRKRSFYLTYLASKLPKDLVLKKRLIGDSYSPCLKLIPAGKLGAHVSAIIHISPEENSFKLNRFLPDKNSIRPNWLQRNDDSKEESTIPTPLYNSLVLSDLTARKNSENIVELLKDYASIKNGIILLKIWLKQRQLYESDAFDGHLLTIYVLHLLKTRKLNTLMSSYNVVRNVWHNLAQSNWHEEGISACESEEIHQRVKEYQKHYDCVFLDFTGYCNLAARLTKDVYLWIREQAAFAVKCLDDPQINSFQVLFMRKVPFYRAFDHFISIKNIESLESKVNESSDTRGKIDLSIDSHRRTVDYVTKLLKSGWKKRISHIVVRPRSSREWEIDEDIPDYREISIGVILNPEFCFENVEKGPVADNPDNKVEEEQFRNLWGNLSELRRYKDGTICESVVWNKGKTLADKRAVCKKMAWHLLTKNAGIDFNDILYFSNQIERVLRVETVKKTKFPYGTGEEASLIVYQTFENLLNEVSSLELPLSVNHIAGSSAVFRYCDPTPPLATSHSLVPNSTFSKKIYHLLEENPDQVPVYTQPIVGILQLADSAKWPDELEALRKTKAAFHIQIAQDMRRSCSMRAIANEHYVDVFKDGFVFRLIIAADREVALVKKKLAENGVLSYEDNAESIRLQKELKYLPILTGALRGLHMQKGVFGPTCCLAKRWFAAQLLDDSHFPEIAIELLVASTLLKSEPYLPTQMPQTAFLRFLEFLSRASWTTEPVFVNFNDQMTREQIVSVENEFSTNREKFPSLFISTPFDEDQSVWTQKAPTTVILNRVSDLASESLRIVETLMSRETLPDLNAIFKAPLSAYDCIIYLKDEFNPRRIYSLDNLNLVKNPHQWHPYKKHSMEKIPIVDFDPVQKYLQDLRKSFGEFALFFHNTYGGSVIAVLLKPGALSTKEFKVSNVSCRKLDATGKLALNVAAMIEDFNTLGSRVVDNIEILSEKLLKEVNLKNKNRS